jgi:hypothetical protein
MAVAGDVTGPCGGKYVRFEMGLRKLQNYCTRTATDFTDISLICKVVLFMFSRTR